MKPLYLLLAAEGHAPPPLVDIDGTVFIQLAIFIILLLVLNRFVFKPYIALRKEREENIDGARQNAAALDDQADGKADLYEERINKTRKEAAAVRAEQRKVGESRASQVLADARQRADAKLEEARLSISKSAQVTQLALRTRADHVARAIASKLLNREV